MSRLTFASLCLAAAPAFGQDIGLGATTQPFWETDPAYQDSDSPALAPTESAGHNAPLNDGTELSRLTDRSAPGRRPSPSRAMMSPIRAARPRCWPITSPWKATAR